MSLKGLLNHTKKNILICPYSYNEGFFKEAEGDYLFDLSFMRPEEFITNILGGYEDNAIVYLNTENDNGRKFTVSGAKSLIEALPFIEGDIKDELSKYYVRNAGYVEYFKDKNLIYLKQLKTNPSFNLALKKATEYGLSFSELDLTPSKDNKVYVNDYKNIIEEVENVVDIIASLLHDGKDINKIKIDVNSDEYYQIFKDVLSFYNIPYTILKKTTLYETKEGLTFCNFAFLFDDETLNDKNLLIEKIDELKDRIPLSQTFYNTLIKFVEGYNSLTYECIKNFLQTSTVKQEKYKDSLEIGNFFDTSLPSDTYLFITGAIQGSFPKTIDPNGLITNEVLTSMSLPTIKEMNTINEEYYSSKIKSINNVFISYNVKGFDKQHSKSSLLDRIPNEGVYTNQDRFRYSPVRDYFKYQKAQEIYDNYDNITDDLVKYYNHAQTMSGNIEEYNPVFKLKEDDTEDFDNLKKVLKDNLILSYSAIDNYYKCPLLYFLKNVIKIDIFEANYNTYLGKFFHAFIEEFIDKEYDEAQVALLYEKFRDREKIKSHYELGPDEKFYFDIFYSMLKEIHNTLYTYRKVSTFKVSGKEQRFETEIKDGRIKVFISGQIDLVLKDDDDNYVIGDYKTGKKPNVDLENGKGMQLFLYFNMIKKDYPNAKPFAFVYQMIHREKKDESKPIKFNGFFINDNDLMKDFTGGIKNTTVDKKLNCNSIDTFNAALDIVNDKIIEAKDRILSLDFKQTPSDDSCMYCNFKDLCYKNQINLEDEEGGSDD